MTNVLFLTGGTVTEMRRDYSGLFRKEEVWDGFLGPTFANQLHALRTMVVTD